MRQEIHPEYGPVAFRDRATGRVLVTRSTLVGRLGDQRIEKFQRRYGRKA